jgi:adenylate cyclase
MSAGTTTLPLSGRRESVQPTAGALLARRVAGRIRAAQTLANAVAAIDVFLLLWFVLPSPAHPGVADSELMLLNGVALAVIFPLCAAACITAGRSTWRRAIEGWLTDARPPDERERSQTLCYPLFCAGIDAIAWTAGAAAFTVLNLQYGGDHAFHVGSTIVMGGVTCTALAYLVTERQMKPVVARALAAGPPTRMKGPGVAGRLVLAWVFATGVPLVGLLLVGWHILLEGGVSAEQAAVNILVLSGVAIASGLLATWLVARSVADPLRAVRTALMSIGSGRLDARVEVDDGSEVGLLQSGFNRMAAGLQERERLRDLFGRHVGEDVARAALDGPDRVALGGEVRDVAVLFVDLCGSTAMAARRPPREVVRVLNDFFAVVVDVVGRHGGWVNKFEGDAAMCVFGAPVDHPDPAGAALAAARDLRRRLHVVRDVDAGIGLSAGPAVAGNVGAEQRFEYTVIGDPVNEAARLCELAKRRDERILASSAILQRSRNGEGERWRDCEDVVLRGRSTPTRTCVPA